MSHEPIFTRLLKHKLSIFSLADLSLLCGEIKHHSLIQALHRWRTKGWVSPLKRGLYVLTWGAAPPVSERLVANRLLQPSCISMESVLSDIGLLPETSMAVVSVTPKLTRRVKNTYGQFIYRHISPTAFQGYEIHHDQGQSILVATPEKAWVDFMYFQTHRGQSRKPLERRVDRTVLKSLHRAKVLKYAKLFGLSVPEIYDAYL